MSFVPLIYEWDGDAMKPLGRFASLANKQFVVHERYRLEVVQDRSFESHKHYFAAVTEAWNNLPEIHANRWRTPDHLRKWALIQAGYKNETTYIAKTKAEAHRFAGFLHSLDEFAEVEVDGCLIAYRTAKSQDYKSMSRKEFQESKDGVFRVLSDLIGVSVSDLKQNAGAAA